MKTNFCGIIQHQFGEHPARVHKMTWKKVWSAL